MIYKIIKRIYDSVGSLLLLILLSPLFILISVIIKIESKGPIFFKQIRIGKDKKQFSILKFRTMFVEAPKDIPTHKLENANKYISKVGKFLRKTSLDEIPQLFNIFKGDMSFVGPRPALWNQNDLIKKRDNLGIHEIYPGITGLAQIKGRDRLSIDEKVNLDYEYFNRMSLFFDIKIIFLTVIYVIKSDDIVEGKKSKKN